MEMNRKHISSWCLFDFANSTYSAVIAAVIFPVYYTRVVVGNEGGQGDLWWGRAISASMLIVALSSPVLGGIADFAGIRKRFLVLFTLMSVFGIAMFATLGQGMVVEGFALIVLANIGMEGGLVFYNSYLPEIAPPSHLGRVSSWGFGVGYMGSIIALAAALPLVKAGHYGATWIMVAAMFLVFALPAFAWLPRDVRRVPLREAVLMGLTVTRDTFEMVRRQGDAWRFLWAYFLFEDGVNTVIVFSSVFAATTLGFAPVELVMLYLIVQGMALLGAFVMAKRVDIMGPRRVVVGSLALWTAVCVAAFFVEGKPAFWAIAMLAGMGLGVVQASARALFASYIPEGCESRYFGLYSLVGKTSAVIGPFLFGTISAAMGSQRPAILSVGLLFLGGLGILVSGKKSTASG